MRGGTGGGSGKFKKKIKVGRFSLYLLVLIYTFQLYHLSYHLWFLLWGE